MHKLWYDLAILPETKDELKQEFELIGPMENPDVNPDDPLSQVEEADFALLGATFPADEQATYDRAVNLKAMCRMGIGYDRVDLAMSTRNGVCAMNTPDSPTESAAELAILMMLNVARPVLPANRVFRQGKWPKSAAQVGFELAGKTLGLIGLGRIGARVAVFARAFDMKVIAHDPFIPAERAKALGVELVGDLEQIYRESDIISLHVPAIPETKGMINAETIAQMKKGAVIINVARGAIVVEADLHEALKSGHLGGAGLDVWDPEPPAPDNPLIQMDNVVAVPHMGGVTREMLKRSVDKAWDSFRMILRGEQPDNLLNPDVWGKRKGQ